MEEDSNFCFIIFRFPQPIAPLLTSRTCFPRRISSQHCSTIFAILESAGRPVEVETTDVPALTTMRLIAVEGSPLSAIIWARVGIGTRVLAINCEEEGASGLSISVQVIDLDGECGCLGGNSHVPEVTLAIGASSS